MGFRCIRTRGKPRRYASGPRGSSFIPHPSSLLRRAFTLIEVLTVIVIIGILAGLITAAAIRARASVKVFNVRKEISDLQAALEAYKLKHKEYPPDCVFLSAANKDMRNIGQKAVLRHLQAAFPDYYEMALLPFASDPNNPDDPRWNRFKLHLAAYNLNPDNFDPAAALVFWLGGLPERVPAAGEKWIPAGFHADKANPFKPGLPRTEPFFTFNADRLHAIEPHPNYPADPAKARPLRYYPPSIDTPYVYFRARRDARTGRFEYGATLPTGQLFGFLYLHSDAPDDHCRAYMEGVPTAQSPRPWCEEQKFQIITSGMDNRFGADQSFSAIGRNLTTGDNISNADFDNITSFAEGKLEDAMQQ